MIKLSSNLSLLVLVLGGGGFKKRKGNRNKNRYISLDVCNGGDFLCYVCYSREDLRYISGLAGLGAH